MATLQVNLVSIVTRSTKATPGKIIGGVLLPSHMASVECDGRRYAAPGYSHFEAFENARGVAVRFEMRRAGKAC